MSKFSYQELEARLTRLEEKLEFVMNAVPIPVQSKVVGLDGKPKVMIMPLRDAFTLMKQAGLSMKVEKREIV